jgi:hypothetical protein
MEVAKRSVSLKHRQSEISAGNANNSDDEKQKKTELRCKQVRTHQSLQIRKERGEMPLMNCAQTNGALREYKKRTHGSICREFRKSVLHFGGGA